MTSYHVVNSLVVPHIAPNPVRPESIRYRVHLQSLAFALSHCISVFEHTNLFSMDSLGDRAVGESLLRSFLFFFFLIVCSFARCMSGEVVYTCEIGVTYQPKGYRCSLLGSASHRI